jgi:hypothetical protein
METQGVVKEAGSSFGSRADFAKEKKVLKDLPSIRLSPEQIEEIHADEYSLMLFYATRVEALTLGEIKRRFPEPTPQKAHSVLKRYVECGLVHINNEGRYYSNYPDNYINYSDYKYDADLEAKKDAKIFELMKEYTGQPEYWATRSYFSNDSFFTQEQTQELKDMFTAIKYKAKQFSNENSKNGKVNGLKFRRLKFYDMILGMLFAVLLFSLPAPQAMAGNDPGGPAIMRLTNIAPIQVDDLIDRMLTSRDILAAGGGNDPGNLITFTEPRLMAKVWNSSFEVQAGGGHDPGGRNSKDGKDRAGGGHDPGKPDAARTCIKEVYESEGRLLDLSDSCLDLLYDIADEECVINGSKNYCSMRTKIENILGSVEI